MGSMRLVDRLEASQASKVFIEGRRTEMSRLLEWLRWAWGHILWFIAALVVLVDPRHIFELAERHKTWSALIVALWTMLVTWASKQRGDSGSSK